MTWSSITPAAKSGTPIWLRAPDMPDQLMRWDATRLNPITGEPGVWFADDSGCTWSDHDPKYGPQEWLMTKHKREAA
jgi:hypothetical protein